MPKVITGKRIGADALMARSLAGITPRSKSLRKDKCNHVLHETAASSVWNIEIDPSLFCVDIDSAWFGPSKPRPVFNEHPTVFSDRLAILSSVTWGI
ncbi:MAG: hypothetical protein Q7N50_14960 [Armatimonadota bacterium]|nr:hypothetical protein [Armatimonadota bacterium]